MQGGHQLHRLIKSQARNHYDNREYLLAADICRRLIRDPVVPRAARVMAFQLLSICVYDLDLGQSYLKQAADLCDEMDAIQYHHSTDDLRTQIAGMVVRLEESKKQRQQMLEAVLDVERAASAHDGPILSAPNNDDTVVTDRLPSSNTASLSLRPVGPVISSSQSNTAYGQRRSSTEKSDK